MSFPRASGVLLHPTSLPGPFGIGDLGDAAYAFVDFLETARQHYWQVLPLSPTGYGDSPYQGLSAFAGSPLLISPARLVQVGDLSPTDLDPVPPFSSERVEFGPVISYKNDLLERASSNFRAGASQDRRDAFERFCLEQSFWLEDAALFLALKKTNSQRPWYEWTPQLAARRPQALAEARTLHASEIENQKYRQWIFWEQWLSLKAYANAHNLRIIGDLPIFVARDSADVWAHPDLFFLDDLLRPTVVSGVPPDYFSSTGQFWGHPLYCWEVIARGGYAWWIDRFRVAFRQADLVRIDHFRGFYDYWEVPAGAPNAIEGRWVLGPGAGLFRAVNAALGEAPVIAEDLGSFKPEALAGVQALRLEFGYPGMKILQFAFSSGPANPDLPHNYTRDYVAYTGTHDNDTTVGWYAHSSTEAERNYAREYLASDGGEIAWDLIRLAWSSVADTAVTPLQDILSLGQAARMNTPATTGPPNWTWRMPAGLLTPALAARLGALTAVYGRDPSARPSSLTSGSAGGQDQPPSEAAVKGVAK